VIYQHPLAYLLGLEGIALLRAMAGEYDQSFTKARLMSVRDLLAASDDLGAGGSAEAVSTEAIYRTWAPWYDQPGNQLIDIEGPRVQRILDGLPAGVALDAASGTGRHGEYLATLGHQVICVDSSPEMLALASEKMPTGTFLTGDLAALPVADDSVDLVVCALALSHVPDLAPVLAEFARVLRPGGHLVISDARGLLGSIGLPIVQPNSKGTFGYVPNRTWATSAYLTAALPLGFQVRHCEEPVRPAPFVAAHGIPPGAVRGPLTLDRDVPPNIWALHAWAADAANAAYRDTPVAIIWHFQL
jgi:SAM-dependent methyltransferase